MDAFEHTSPMMNLTLSWSITLFAALTAGSGVHWLSSTTVTIFLPFTPPLAFHSSTASRAPSRVDTPKVGTGPDRGANTATLRSPRVLPVPPVPPLGAAVLQAVARMAAAANNDVIL